MEGGNEPRNSPLPTPVCSLSVTHWLFQTSALVARSSLESIPQPSQQERMGRSHDGSETHAETIRPQGRAARLEDQGPAEAGSSSSNPHPSRNSPSNGQEPPGEGDSIPVIADGPEGPHPRHCWAFRPREGSGRVKVKLQPIERER